VGKQKSEESFKMTEGDDFDAPSPSTFTGLTEDSLNQGQSFRMMGR
jgi:hypothetical protein